MMKDTKSQRDARKGSRIPSRLQFHHRWETKSEKAELEIHVNFDLNNPGCREKQNFQIIIIIIVVAVVTPLFHNTPLKRAMWNFLSNLTNS